MKIKSKGYTVTYTLQEAKVLKKLIGNSTIHSLCLHFDMTENEAKVIQKMFTELYNEVPTNKDG